MNETDLEKVVSRISTALRDLAISFHVTGGVATSYYGQPRMTLDLDVVIRLDNESTLDALVQSLCAAFYIDSESLRSSIQSNQMFQALDEETYIKVDFHVGERIAGELGRSVSMEMFPDVEVPVASVEDVVLSKLIWYAMGSDRSWHDALHVVRRQRKKLDVDLLTGLAGSLNLSAELSRLLEEAHAEE